MPKRQGHLLSVTFQDKEDASLEKLAYAQCDYEKTIQLPLAWKLERCGL